VSTSRTAVVVLVFAVLAAAQPVAGKEPVVKGDRLVFALPDLDGNNVESADDVFAGRVLLVTLWGTWCPPCVSEIPTLNDLQRRFAAAGLTVVAIAFEKTQPAAERRGHLQKFVQQHEIEYLVLDGGDVSEFAQALPMLDDVKGLPIEIVIDRAGVVVDCRNGYGYNKSWARKLENRLKDLLAVE